LGADHFSSVQALGDTKLTDPSNQDFHLPSLAGFHKSPVLKTFFWELHDYRSSVWNMVEFSI
jgi:hypothetical protein